MFLRPGATSSGGPGPATAAILAVAAAGLIAKRAGATVLMTAGALAGLVLPRAGADNDIGRNPPLRPPVPYG